jgi:glycerophosphoryl diester phosphodiesterase
MPFPQHTGVTHTTASHQLEIFAHRGLSLDSPENTLASFKAVEAYEDAWVEIDVHTTADGIAVVSHDPTLDRVAGVPGKIAAMSFAQLQAIDLPDGHKVPTLLQTLQEFPKLSFNIDMKDYASARTVPQVLGQIDNPKRIRITSFSERTRRRAYKELCALGLDKMVPLGASEILMGLIYISSWFGPRVWIKLAPLVHRYLPVADALQIPESYEILGRTWNILTPSLLKTAHVNGYKVHVWTVDEPSCMRRLFDMGVNGIVSNRIDILESVRREYTAVESN